MNVRRLRSATRRAVSLGFALAAVLVHRRYRRDIVAAYERAKHGGRILVSARGPIEYTDVGHGPAVLIVHGAGGGYDQGAFFARTIGGPFRWLAPSRFGFLATPVAVGADSALQADAHACLLDALQVDRVAVVGVSMGGPSALVFALRYPHRTTSLVLISAASHAIEPRPALLSAVFNVFLNDFGYWAMAQFAPRALRLLDTGVRPQRGDEVIDRPR